MAEGNDRGEVTCQVRFVTKISKYAVPEAPISLPVNLRRYALSEVINHLLALDKPVVFDFLIDGQFLRTSIDKYLKEKGLTTENVITIEYAEAVPPPTPMTSFKHDDWVASAHAGQNGLFLTGTYDHAVQIWTAAGQCLATARAHTEPIKRVRWITAATDSPSMCVSASQDHTMIVWEYDGETDSLSGRHQLKGHTGSVDGVAVSPDSSKILSGSFDKSLRLWDVAGEADEPVTEHRQGKKKQKVGTGQAKTIIPKASTALLAGHQGPVSAVVWPEAHTSFSAGWDHTVRQWDLSTGINVHTMTGTKSITDLTHSRLSGLLATAGADKLLRVWDPKDKSGVVVKLKLSSHTEMVSCAAWSPTNPHQLVSGDYAGTWKLWDIRSNTPLHSLQAHEDKILCIDWSLPDVVLTGGADCKLGVHNVGKKSTSE